MASLIEKEKAARAFQGGAGTRLLRHAKALAAAALLCTLAYAGYVAGGLLGRERIAGRIGGLPLHAPVAIVRDPRGIPHIRAQDAADMFFAEGFAQGSDRLFQMDLLRLYVYGKLAEVLGPIQLPGDERMRAFGVREIAAREWRHLSKENRTALQSFTAGVNAAMRIQPLPVEFRLLLYRPARWKPADSLAVTLAISSALGDTPENVVQRDALWHTLSHKAFAQLLPLSDPAYDVSAAALRPRAGRAARPLAWVAGSAAALVPYGSNAWAAGGSHTVDGRALLANDPHLSEGIPGLWYAIEMRAPGFHAAGATIPGIPGVVLGHNERIAWATTNAMASTLSVFHAGRLHSAWRQREVFHVRFAPDVTRSYYRGPREFGIPADTPEGIVLVRWRPYEDDRSALATVLALDRARSAREALRDLANYAGPPQNFIVADSTGAVAYHLAGAIADDPAWGRYVHPATGTAAVYPIVPFARLPAIAPSRDAVALSANNKMYAAGYPYRLSPMFAPPYRAFRIAALLHARPRYDAAYFARMQLDEISPADAQFAHGIAAYARSHPGFLPPAAADALARWNGRFSPASRTASLVRLLRSRAEAAAPSPYAAFEAVRARTPPEQFLDALRDPLLRLRDFQPWRQAGAIAVLHPFGAIGFPFLNGDPLPGDGDEYTIRVQTAALTQSFRAVWDVGAWEKGGLSLPSGESGRIGSPYYDDLRAAWIGGALTPLPFSDSAVRRAARSRLLLEQ